MTQYNFFNSKKNTNILFWMPINLAVNFWVRISSWPFSAPESINSEKTKDAKNCVKALTNKFLHKPGLILFAKLIFRNSQEHLCNNRQILRTLSYMKIIYRNKLKQHCNYFLRLNTNKLLTPFFPIGLPGLHLYNGIVNGSIS